MLFNGLYSNKQLPFILRAVHRATRIFLSPFPPAHSPKRQPCGAWLTVFREKSLRKPAQAYRKTGFRHPCEREQELLSRFPIGKPSPLCSPPAGRSFLTFQQANVATGAFGSANQVSSKKIIPASVGRGKFFVGKICIARPLRKPAYVKRKRPTRRKTHKKKVGFTGNRKKVQ